MAMAMVMMDGGAIVLPFYFAKGADSILSSCKMAEPEVLLSFPIRSGSLSLDKFHSDWMARTGLTARYVHGYMYIHVMHVV
jgi:hypothetical protein